MDFFEQEVRARKQTRRLLVLFGLAVLVVVVLTNLVLAFIVEAFAHPELPGPWWNPFAFLANALALFGEALLNPLHFLQLIGNPYCIAWVTLITLASIILGCFYKLRQLSDGGSVVAELLGGRRVEPETADADEQRLQHVVGEMAIASGLPVPDVYVLDNERGVNAFAAGYTRDDVVIGITRGGLNLLTRDELQGVVAHEFSHILNGDTRLNMRLMALAHGLFWPTILGRVLMYGSSEAPAPGESILDENDELTVLPTAPLGVLLVIIGSLSLPFVRVIKSAICREREWLADAAAVQFTRHPAGIAGALKKIGGLWKHGRLDIPSAEIASHLYFAESAYDPWFAFMSVHPPVAKRVRAIDSTFDGRFPKVKMLAPNQYERDQAYEHVLARTMALDRKLPDKFEANAGDITADCLKQASLMRLGLPPEVQAALLDPTGATAVIYALLLSDDVSVQAKQLQILRANSGPELLEETTSLAPQIRALGDRYKLALAEFAVPTLRQHVREIYTGFGQTIQQLIESDGAIELFEYAVMKLVARRLQARFEGPDLNPSRYGRVQDVLPECALLLSALAHVSQDDESEARKAFDVGSGFLDALGAQIQFVARDDWDLAKVDTVLTRLAQCPAAVQRNILLACGKTVATDGRVTERAAELLRAIADSLDCPMPPFVDAIRSEQLAQNG